MQGQQMECELEGWAARAAQSYQELAEVFSGFVAERREQPRKNLSRRMEYITEKLCGNCPCLEYCRGREDRQEALKEAVYTADQAGEITPEQLPYFFREECLQKERMAEELNTLVFMEQVKSAAFNQMMEGKEALVHQLEETAHYFREIQDTFRKNQYLSPEQQKDLILFLRRYHLKARDLETCQKNGKGRELRMRLRTDGAKRAISMGLVERILEELLGFPVRECSRPSRYISEEEKTVVFREEPGYYTLTGVARMVKQEQQISGDSFSFFYEEEGEMAMILSDGMGSGEEAERESESVLRLLERMLSAGFREETAIRLLNSVLALRVEQKMFATLDISRLNLYSGTCEFIKIGGAATYLRRGNWIECVEAKTLPIGMVQRVDYDFMVKKLYDGDYIIMMSDGVLDAVPEEKRAEFLQNIIGQETEQNPQVIAGRILNASLLVQNFEPRDDMTVLVCGIFHQKQRKCGSF